MTRPPLAAVAMACAMGLVACGTGAEVPRAASSSSTSRGLCEARFTYDGTEYVGWGGVVRDPGLTGRTVAAMAQWCDDTGSGAKPDTPVEASVLTGIEPTLALFADGTLYVREGAEPPAWTERWFTVPSCRSAGTFEIAGEWTGVDPSREARFDGDLRLPYRVFMHVDSGPRRYVGAQLKLRATATTKPALGPTDVRTALWESGRVTARVRCHAGNFKAVELRSVPVA